MRLALGSFAGSLIFLTVGCGFFLEADAPLFADSGMDAASDAFFPDAFFPDASPPDSSADADPVDECREDADCEDDSHCNGAETCEPSTFTCVSGTPEPDGSACTIAGAGGACMGGFCVSETCGNGVVDGGEQCDDGDDMAGDGCDPDCTYSCETAADCATGGTPCSASVCDVTTHTCTLVPRDTDGDGYLVGGACGGMDCDDTNPDVHPGRADSCNMIDDDCDAAIDEDDPPYFCWPDADGDGHGRAAASPTAFCGSTVVCPAGFVDAPGGDCLDSATDPTSADVHPRQPAYFPTSFRTPTGLRSFDYDCDGLEQYEFPARPMCPSSSGDSDCLFSQGFIDLVIPGCGDSGTFVSCRPGLGGSGCTVDVPVTMTQSCR